MIRFICEFSRRTEFPPEIAISAVPVIDQEGQIVSTLYTGSYPTSSYWLDWGGSYDNPTTNFITLYFGGFLADVSSLASMVGTDNSLFRSGTDRVYFVTDKHPWQYLTYQTELGQLEGYSTSVSDETNPSNDILDGRRYPTLMQIPKLQVKIPDDISGSALQFAVFNINLINNDGFFDIPSDNNFFNVPMFVKKSSVNTPTYSDFELIRRGLVDNYSPNFTQLNFSVAITYRSLSDPVCKTISITEFPNVNSDNLGKKIPVGWGSLTNLDLILVDTRTYLIIDPDYLVSIDTVYDSDGAVIPSTDYTVVSGLLIMNVGADEPDKADVTALSTNKIGEIIINEIQEKSNIFYSDDFWDVTETDEYINSSPEVNLFFEGNSVRDLIKEVLKSDNSFLIEKSTGKLSLRKWARNYSTHVIPSWAIVKVPDLSHVNSKFYASNAVVFYDGGQVVDDSRENQIIEIYRKKQIREYRTKLANQADASSLASAMLDRYGQRAEVWKIVLPPEFTRNVSLLDKVILDIQVNDRLMSDKNIFIVKSVDLGQDELVLESVGTRIENEGVLAEPTVHGKSQENYDKGDMSGPFFPNSPAIMPQINQRKD